jgi:hypothetical protein
VLPLPHLVGVPVRRPLLLSLARAGLNATAVILLYYLLPLNRGVSRGTVGWLVGGLVLVALLVTWQIRAILRARYPGLRAVEALATSIPLFLVVFACVYEMMTSADAGAFSQSLTRTDILYFVVTVFATVGFGDITPVTEAARVVVMVQMLGDLVLIGLVVRAFLAAATRGRAQRDQDHGATQNHGAAQGRGPRAP